MTSPLAELVFSGGGLEGASEKQVRAILAKLEQFATVVEHRTLPEAVFGVTDSEPHVVFYRRDGGGNSTSSFVRDHLSPSRAMRAVREAMAVHAALSSDDAYISAAYASAREQFLRNELEADSVAAGGSRNLAEGAL